jgi:starch synthase (maltosyl-transferring)
MPPRKSDRRTIARRVDHLLIECVTPELDGGRYAVKRVVGDVISVGADIIKEGHDRVAARLLAKGPGETTWHPSPMLYDYDTDRWFGAFTAGCVGRWTFTVEAWTDRFSTWRDGLRKKIDAGQSVDVELLEGAQLARTAARSVRSGPARASLLMTAKMLDDRRDTAVEHRLQRALDDDLLAFMQEYYRSSDLTRLRDERAVVVDRERARFAAWYEMFPRSQVTPSPAAGDGPPRHGTFADAAARLPRLAELGFDVVYLPPIHPVGRSHRKGKNNSLTPDADDVGSPWAIGNEHGGHTAIEPALGGFPDFEQFVSAARDLGMEVALDYALQCSPDHPWVKAHPDWFHVRPDGSIKHAENPPKKYQDIVPLNFWCADRQALWNACRDVLLFWIERGVTTFRVDNPHTKPMAFWEWLIDDVQRTHPDAIFFSEAFTRPKRLKALAKLGFTMSYTYFTWKNRPWELRALMDDLVHSPAAEYLRGNLFANTPDILNEYLVDGGRPAFRARLLLAATLSPLYGIYSGFELCENVPAQPGSEEYLDSEKYQIRPRQYDAPGNINADVARLNATRRAQPALQRLDNLSFHESENPEILFYRRAAASPAAQWTSAAPLSVPVRIAELLGDAPAALGDDLLVVVNTDPHHVQESMIHVPIHDLGIDDQQPYAVRDLLTGARFTWRGARNYVRLDPAVEPGHLFVVER